MRRFLSRLLELVFRRRREERLSEEMQVHLELLTDQYVEDGLSRDDARMKARRSFGGVEQVRMTHRELRGFPGVDALLQDVRFGGRVLARERGFALTVILVLGVGIGVNNMFFTMVYAHKFRGLSFPDAERVLSISTLDDRGAARSISVPEYTDLSRAQTSFTGIAAYTPGVVTLGDDGRAPDRYDATYLSANALPELGIAPLAGRLFRPDEDRPGQPAVVVLGETAWRLRYHADAGVVGRSVLVNGEPATVIGVLRDQSGFPSGAGVWLPLGQFPGIAQGRAVRSLRAFARLRDGVPEAAARSEVEALFTRFAEAFPENRGLRARVVRLNDFLLGPIDGWEPFILAGIIVVLVACANVGNLMVARGLSRAPEIAVRTSLGASRARIVRQLMVEALILASLGGALGAVISIGGVRLFASQIPAGTLPYWFGYRMDAGVFTGLVVVSLITVVVFGLIPAWQASRTDVNHTLKDGGRGHAATGQLRVWTGAFLTAELALALIMLTQVAIGALTSQVELDTDRALDTTAVITASVALPNAAYPDAERRNAFFRAVADRLSGHGVVTETARATVLPGEGGGFGMRRLAIERQPGDAAATPPEVQTIEISPRYFAAIGVGEPRGRGFVDGIDAAGDGVAIVNERFVAVHLGGRDAIGARIAVTDGNARADAAPRWLTIVGVAPEIRQQGPRGQTNGAPVVYLPIDAASPPTSILIVRHQGDAAAVTDLVRAEAQAVDAGIPLYRTRTLAQAVRDAQWNARVSAYLSATVCLISVLLAVVGLYAVTAQRVTLKTQEIGLRMALGAGGGHIGRVVLGGLRVPLLLGLVLGTIGALAWERTFTAQPAAAPLISATQTLFTVGALLGVVMLAACFVPVRRAARLSPIAALRHH